MGQNMVTQLHSGSNLEAPVVVTGGIAHFDGYANGDPDVVRVLEEADDIAQAADLLLGIGARATRQASVSLETAIVERRFEGMAGRLDEQLQGAVEAIEEVADGLLDDEDGALTVILSDLRRGITGALDSAFDPESKTSAIGKIDQIMADAVDRLTRKVRETLDPGALDSPMARATRLITDTVKEQSDAILVQLKDVAVAVAVGAARAEVEAKTTGKGFRYEDAVQAWLERIAAVHGDLAEHTGHTSGAAGTQNGDHCVSLAAEDTCGIDVRIVFESKDKAMTMPKAMAEIDKAMKNHQATAGVLVFAGQNLAPTGLPFAWWGNRAIVVAEDEEPDGRALHLAYAWARWVARRSVSAEDSGVDLVRVEAALAAARRALAKHQSIKACHSAARKKIEEGAQHVADMVDDLDVAIVELWEAVTQ
jgi:hypothetical protein